MTRSTDTAADTTYRLDVMRDVPADLADAIDRLARLTAVASWVGDLTASVRRWVDDHADRVEELTGTAFTAKAASGTAGRSGNPDPTVGAKVKVVDVDLLPDHLVATRDAVGIADPDAALDLHHAATTDTADLDQLRTMVARALTVDVVRYADTDAIDQLTTVMQPDGTVATVDVDTGELVTVPGLGWTPVRRTLTVTIPKQVKASLRDDLDRLVGRPSLDVPDRQEQA